MLKSRQISMTKNSCAYLSGRITTSLRTRQLCDVPTATCWKCSYSYSTNSEAVFFCPSCNVVQEPNSDKTFFDIMNW